MEYFKRLYEEKAQQLRDIYQEEGLLTAEETRLHIDFEGEEWKTHLDTVKSFKNAFFGYSSKGKQELRDELEEKIEGYFRAHHSIDAFLRFDLTRWVDDYEVRMLKVYSDLISHAIYELGENPEGTDLEEKGLDQSRFCNTMAYMYSYHKADSLEEQYARLLERAEYAAKDLIERKPA